MKDEFYENNTDDSYYFNFHLAKNNFMPAHYHKSTEIIFVRQGRVKVIVNGKERILSAKEIAVFNRFDVHCICGEEKSELYILVFSEMFYPKLARGFVLENFLSTGKNTEEVFSLLDYFYRLRESSTHMMQAGFIEMLLGILYASYSVHEEKWDDGADYYIKILRYIDKNCAEALTLENIAAHFGYTKHYFSMLFNKFTGMHLREYLNRLRVERVAMYKKEHPDESISRIAFACGFNSLNTYYRALKNIEKDNIKSGNF